MNDINLDEILEVEDILIKEFYKIMRSTEIHLLAERVALKTNISVDNALILIFTKFGSLFNKENIGKIKKMKK